jgi:hypothetical protein
MTNGESGLPGAGLLIGDVARLCGVTPRAVRHYHALGLLPEPERDSSGYRRYAAADVAAALPRPADAPAAIDVAVMDKLLGDRLNPAQRQFMFQLRRLLDGPDE